MSGTITLAEACAERARWVRVGWWCAGISFCWNVVEGVVAVWAGEVADSVALIGFGLNSFIETASAGVIAWRLLAERHDTAAKAQQVERVTGRWMGVLLGVLALYIGIESMRRLLGWGPAAQESIVGLALTGVSLMVMPGLFLTKRRVARELNSAAVRADGIQTLACWWLSLGTFVGLGLNALLGWGWADPLAGLFLVPFILKEASAAWRGDGCGCGVVCRTGAASFEPTQ